MNSGDVRIPKGKYRLETILVSADAPRGGGGVASPGDGAIVAYILASTFTAPGAGAGIGFGPQVGASNTVPLVVVTPDHPSAVLRIDDFGSILWLPMYAFDITAAVSTLAVWKVIKVPEE